MLHFAKPVIVVDDHRQDIDISPVLHNIRRYLLILWYTQAEQPRMRSICALSLKLEMLLINLGLNLTVD